MCVWWDAISSTANWEPAPKLCQSTNIIPVTAKKKSFREKKNIMQHFLGTINFQSGNWKQSKQQEKKFSCYSTASPIIFGGFTTFTPPRPQDLIEDMERKKISNLKYSEWHIQSFIWRDFEVPLQQLRNEFEDASKKPTN